MKVSISSIKIKRNISVKQIDRLKQKRRKICINQNKSSIKFLTKAVMKSYLKFSKEQNIKRYKCIIIYQIII